MNWEQLRSPDRAAFKTPKISLLIGNNWKYGLRPTLKNPIFESPDKAAFNNPKISL